MCACRYEFVNPSDKHVQWLWEVLEEFDNEDRARFIDFCYARCVCVCWPLRRILCTHCTCLGPPEPCR